MSHQQLNRENCHPELSQEAVILRDVPFSGRGPRQVVLFCKAYKFCAKAEFFRSLFSHDSRPLFLKVNPRASRQPSDFEHSISILNANPQSLVR